MPAERTLPIKTSWTLSAEMFAFVRAASMAAAPRRGAGTVASEPRKAPIGVRVALTM
jgi:hypothetical protein